MQAQPADRTSAAVLFALGALIYFFGTLPSSLGFDIPNGDFAVSGILLLAAFLVRASNHPSIHFFVQLAVTGAALFAVAGPLLSLPNEDLSARLGALQFWPQILTALSCGFGLAARARSDPTGAADFCFGAAVAAALISVLAVLEMNQVLTVIARGPVHIALLINAGTAASVILRATMKGQTKRTRAFSLGVAGLLPLMGFLGTIVGIIAAMRNLPALFDSSGAPDQDALDMLLTGMASAFETTMIGITAAVIAGVALTLLDTRDAETA